MKMQEAIIEALKRLDCEPDQKLVAAFEKNIGPEMLAVVIPDGCEEGTIRALMTGMLNGIEDEHRSFSA